MSLLNNLRFAVQRMRGRSRTCEHTNEIREVGRSSEGCEQCVALGDTWVHLRMCMSCGQVGCCDSSKNRHAHRHSSETGHPIARSAEPGETWMWCFVDETIVEVR